MQTRLVLIAMLIFQFMVVNTTWAAERDCDTPELDKETRLESVFKFRITRTCNSTGVHLQDIIERYKTTVATQKGWQVVASSDLTQHDDSHRATLQIVERVQTGRGKLTIYSDLSLTSDLEHNFSYKYLSSKIEGTGAAANTRKVVETLNVSSEDGNGFSVVIAKEVYVNKPWYAPKPIFLAEVHKGIRNDMEFLTTKHLARLEGRQ